MGTVWVLEEGTIGTICGCWQTINITMGEDEGEDEDDADDGKRGSRRVPSGSSTLMSQLDATKPRT